MKTVSVFMDVEDPINPLADDAALDFARLFSSVGVRGSFCLTGEKCRTLVARGRIDVIDAYRPHCLALHTDTHSFHPTTIELLADVDFATGCEKAYAAEQRGFGAFVEAFGRPPDFWGGAGNTWSCEVTDALKRLGIPAYVYALTALPDEAVHRFNGVVALPQAASIGENDWQDDARAEARSARVLDQIEEIPQPWIGVFVGHPTKFRHRDFWDVPYYAGRTPPYPEHAELLPDEAYRLGIDNLACFLGKLQKVAKVVGIDQALAMPWRFRPPTEAERTYFFEHTGRNLRGAVSWPVHRPGLSGENLAQKALALVDTVEVAEI